MSKIINILVWLLIQARGAEDSYCKIVDNTIDCSNHNLFYVPIKEISLLNTRVPVLDISNNNLTLSGDVGNFMNLPSRLIILELRLNNNFIENLPDNLSDILPNLRNLSLQSNNITYLSKKLFLGYKNLKNVCLDHNPINDTVLENLKTELPLINFQCPETNDNKREETPTTESDSHSETRNSTKVEAISAKKAIAKTNETTNSASEETPTTKSDSLLTTLVNRIDNNSSKSPKTSSSSEVEAISTKKGIAKTNETTNSASGETPTTKRDSNNIRLIIVTCIAFVVILVILVPIIYKIYSCKKNRKLEETQNSEGDEKLLEVVSSSTDIKDNVTASNIEEEIAKTSKTTNSASRDTDN